MKNNYPTPLKGADNKTTPLTRLFYDDDGLVECDVCGEMVPFLECAVEYDAQADIVTFTCCKCADEEPEL